MKIDYIACIFCGKNQPLSQLRGRDLSKLKIPPVKFRALQIREAEAGAGRGHKGKGVGGFKLIEEDCLTLQEMLENPKYGEVAEQLKGRLVNIVKAYKKAGIIKRGEV